MRKKTDDKLACKAGLMKREPVKRRKDKLACKAGFMERK